MRLRCYLGCTSDSKKLEICNSMAPTAYAGCTRDGLEDAPVMLRWRRERSPTRLRSSPGPEPPEAHGSGGCNVSRRLSVATSRLDSENARGACEYDCVCVALDQC